MLNDKELTVLNSLYQWNRPVQIQELATAHKLSDRSIRSYIARINKDFKFECVSLHKGFYTIENREFLHDFFQNYQVSNYSGQALTELMLHKLLLNNKINLSHFVIEYEVSRSTAKNYLNAVKEQLEQYQLKLDHSAGITLLGKESDKRQMILNLYLQVEKRQRVERELLSPLFEDYETLVEERILQEFLDNMLSVLDYQLSTHSHKILLCYLKIMLSRMNQDFLHEDIMNKTFLEQSSEYQKTLSLFQDLESAIDKQSIPLNECLEVINKVMGLHYSNNKEEEHHNWFEYDLFISKMIRRFSKACGYNLVGDFQLYENLLNHIKPSMYRIAHKIELHQFDKDYIIEQEEYSLTEKILQALHFFPQDPSHYVGEIALICIYFKQALEKQKTQVKQNILLISNYGYGSSRVMMEKIKEYYHIGEMTWIPSQEALHIDKQLYHLLISTDSKIQQDPLLPVVNISPFLQPEDRQKLSLYLSPKEPEKVLLSQLLPIIEAHGKIEETDSLKESLCQQFGFIDDTEKKQGILDFMTEESILLDYPAQAVWEVLETSGKLLEKQGYTDPSYTSHLIESFENYGVYMMIDTDVAIPHTKNSGNVHKTGFTFIRLSEPLDFADHQLSMFFTFCTRNNKEHLEALILIADIIKDEETKKSMETLATAKEILEFLANNEEHASNTKGQTT